MRLHPAFMAFVSAVAIVLGAPDIHAQTSSAPRNFAGLELLGRAGIYSVNYERLITRRIGLGIGVATWSVSSGFFSHTQQDTLHIPMYVSWTPVGQVHSLYLAAGTTVSLSLGTSSGGTTFEAHAMRTTTLGYQYRSEGGLLVRPTVNYLAHDRGIVWPGVTVGWTF